MAHFGNQLDVAHALGVTDRRVRQLEAEHIIPPPASDGRYDVALCEERFNLYRGGSDREWERFYADLEAETREVDRLINEGPGQVKTLDEVKGASSRLQDLFAAIRFTIVCKDREDSFPRQAMLEKFQRTEDEGLGRLLGVGLRLLAEQRGVPYEDVVANLEAESRGEIAAEPAAPAGSPTPNRRARRAAARRAG